MAQAHVQTTVAEKRAQLAASAAARKAMIAELRGYLSRAGITHQEIARRIGYSKTAVDYFINDRYEKISGSDTAIRTKLREFMDAHPVGAQQMEVFGQLFETENSRMIRSVFERLLQRPHAQVLYGPPGSQKTFTLQHEIRALNERELRRNGQGRRAFYVYSRQGITPYALVRRIARATGCPVGADTDGTLNNIAFEFRGRRVVLALDEGQHLSIPCLETIRELLDNPPHFSLLIAGSHDLNALFEEKAARLLQLSSRVIENVLLPGITPDEAAGIIQRELGTALAASTAAKQRAKIGGLIEAATVKDVYAHGRKYINVRTLTNSLNLLKETLR